MATVAKSVGKAAISGLRLVVVGQGQTRGRRPHLLRIRESIFVELKQVADGQMYLLVELALQKFIAELKALPPGIQVIQSHEMEPGPEDDAMMDQHIALMAKKEAAEKKAKALKKPKE